MSEHRAMIRFPGAFGTTLAARLDLPPENPVAFALFAHCFSCSKDTLAASRICADQIEREIEIAGNVDDGQRARLLDIAEKCPVHRTLRSEIRTVTRLRS